MGGETLPLTQFKYEENIGNDSGGNRNDCIV